MEDHQTPQKNHSRQSDTAKETPLKYKSFELKPNPPSSQITINTDELSTKHHLSRPDVRPPVRFQAIRRWYNAYFDIPGLGANISEDLLVAVIKISFIVLMASVLIYLFISDKYLRSRLQVCGSFAAAGFYFGLISFVWSGDTVFLRCSRCAAVLAMPIAVMIYMTTFIGEPGSYILIGAVSTVSVVSLLLKKNESAQVQPQP